MRKVELRVNELEKYEIIKKIVDSNGNKKHAAVLLQYNLRTIYNLIKIYQEKGKAGFINGNRNRKPVTSLPDKIKNRIVHLYKEFYQDTNFTHFMELLKRDYSIEVSYFTLYNILSKAGFISPKCERSTRRRKQKEIRAKINNKKKLTSIEENIVLETHILDSIDAHPRKPRAALFGELLQMDASDHLWFGNKKSQLHIAIDDATGRIVGAYFDHQETLNGYYHVFHQILTKYGVPCEFLTDNRTVFIYKKEKNPTLEKDTFTQFGYACKQLGVVLTTSSIPQVKGRVERCFGTLQSRLPVELRLAGVTTVDEANKFLDSYIDEFNKSFALPINDTKNAFEKQVDSITINYTLAIISRRKIDNGSCVKYNGKYYQLYNQNDQLMCVVPKTKCLIIKAFNGQLYALINEFVYNLAELPSHRQDNIFKPIKDISKPKYTGHTPPMSHPWKEASFNLYLSKLKHVNRDSAHV